MIAETTLSEGLEEFNFLWIDLVVVINMMSQRVVLFSQSVKLIFCKKSQS